MRNGQLILVFPVFAVLLTLSGCGSNTSTVSGTVTYKGSPLTNVQIDFVPVDGGPTFTAMTNSSGKYQVDVPNGTCKVTVISQASSAAEPTVKSMKDPKSSVPPPKAAATATPPTGLEKPTLPAKYASPTTTPLTVNVTNSSTVFDIPLVD
jgi:uncharacterized protein YceK